MIVLGRVVAPFGVRGWLRIHPYGDDPGRWQELARWWLRPDVDGGDDCWSGYQCESVKLHGGSVIAKLVGMDDRNAAESLVGYFFGASREELPAPRVGEFYWTDLIGLTVVSLSGESLGAVDSLIETGAHHVLVVLDGDRKRLIPLVESVVNDVDVAKRAIRVDWEKDW